MQGLMRKKQGGCQERGTADEVRAGSCGAPEGLQVLGGCEGQDEGGLELKRGHRGNLPMEKQQCFFLAVLRLQSHTQIYLYFI